MERLTSSPSVRTTVVVVTGHPHSNRGGPLRVLEGVWKGTELYALPSSA